MPFQMTAMVGAAGPGCRLRAGQPRQGRNIVFILADDLGRMDSTIYGSRYCETPNLERLAGRGMTFTDAYAANPLCSPTRASIMTGKYPARLGITTPAGHLPAVPDEPIMADRGRREARGAIGRGLWSRVGTGGAGRGPRKTLKTLARNAKRREGKAVVYTANKAALKAPASGLAGVMPK